MNGMNKLHVYLSLVFLCCGYLIAFAYNYSQDHPPVEHSATYWQWEKEDQLREKLLEITEENQEKERMLRELQIRVSEKEEELAQMENKLQQTIQELETYRLLAGIIETQGPGVIVTLEDSEYVSDAQNPNDYIVHEQDVRRVVNELLAAGAEGISINEQRYIHSTAIRCVGPTIIVNNVKSTAPFQIKAIGDPDTLYNALNMPGGIVDTFQMLGITIKLEKNDQIFLPAYVGEL